MAVKVLVLGVTGMLGNAVFDVLNADPAFETWGSMRSGASLRHFDERDRPRLRTGVDVLDHDALVAMISELRPAVVINCVGLIKQLAEAEDPLLALPINAMLPHRLARLCQLAESRLVHISTDCVFSGKKGGYTENEVSDAEDLYGKSKYIGEVHDLYHAVTLRTSIIGHELQTSHALVDWFLSQNGTVKGYSRAVFSGLPTVELASIIKDHVLPNPDLSGLYHVAAAPISKFELLRLIAAVYEKSIEIRPDAALLIDRSLNARRFAMATGYVAPEWPELVRRMHASHAFRGRDAISSM